MLHAEDADEAFAAVITADGWVFFLLEVVSLGVLVDGTGEGVFEAGEVRAAIGVRDGIGEAERLLGVAVVPLHHAVHEAELPLFIDLELALAAEGDGLVVHDIFVLAELLHEFGDTILVKEHFRAGGLNALISQGDADAGIQEGELAQALGQKLETEGDGDGEDRRIGKEGDLCAGALRVIQIAEHTEGLCGFATLEADGVDLAVAIDLGAEPIGQGIHALGSDAVQAAGELIGTIAKFAASVQVRQHQLNGGDAFLGVDFHGNATAIVLDAKGAIAVNGDKDVFAVAGQEFVDGVVHNFKDAVVEAALIGEADIHAGAFAHGLEAFELADLGGVIGLPFSNGGGEFHFGSRDIVWHKIVGKIIA